MPIKGLTDNIKPTFPELGRLRKGAKKTNQKMPGEDLTYFRFTSDRGDVEEAFHKAYNGKPTLINVFLPYPNAEPMTQDGEGNFSAWCEKWNGSGTLLHRCDGEYVVRHFDDKKGQYIDPVPNTMKCPGGCTQVGRLTVMIPELFEAGFVGHVVMETHAKNDILSILGSLLETERKRTGHPDGLMGIRFTLQRVDETVSSPSWNDEPKSKRHKVVKSLVKLTPSVTWVQAQLQMDQQRALPAPTPDQEVQTPEETLKRNNAILHSTDEEIDTITGEIIDIDAVAQAAIEDFGDVPIDNTPFKSPAEAVKWGMDQGVFKATKHAQNAYNKIKAEKKPATAGEMARLWRIDVAHRVADMEAVKE